MQGRAVLGWCLEQLASQSSILLWIEEHTYCTAWDCFTLRVNSGNSYEKWVRTQQKRRIGRVAHHEGWDKAVLCGCCKDEEG